MLATEAANYSDVIRREGDVGTLYYRINSVWYYRGAVKRLEQCIETDYVPLVPKKVHSIGDEVTFLEALNSGMCFTMGSDKTVCYKYVCIHQGGLFSIKTNDTNSEWESQDHAGVNWCSCHTCTICADPSVPPKPTLRSLPAWTRCTVRPENHKYSSWDVIIKPDRSLASYSDGKDLDFDDATLLAVYNPKTDSWYEV